MARSFISTVRKISREMDRASRAVERSSRARDKHAKQQYINSRMIEVDRANNRAEDCISFLNELLLAAIGKDINFNFDAFIKASAFVPQSAPNRANFHPYKPHPNKIIAWIPGIRKLHATNLKKAEQNFNRKLEDYNKAVFLRQEAIDFKSKFEVGEPKSVERYFQLVLSASKFPKEFTRASQIKYIPESKQLLVEYELPEIKNIIPTVKRYKYIKSYDNVTETIFPENQRKKLYDSVIGQTILRCLYEMFEADYKDYVELIVLNGCVDTLDKSTGKPIRPCLVTVRVTTEQFLNLNLSHVDSLDCLRGLNASVSRSLAELIPVRPLLEFNMLDPRFIEESDVLSTLDQRPDLMSLTPADFESLITNLFQAMGLETKLTQASRDGGVDCVAYDPRPIFGGKVVIQAKRYKNTVGVSAVRDLFGTMLNEGASKGILITTSGYGKAAYDFANGKPIELLSGSNLLYLLKEHADLDAKIIMPDNAKKIPVY